jgi:FMN-dependent NADH-azoreductase
MPGTLKIFFDRNVPLFEYCEAKAIRYVPKPQLKGKKAILIVSGGSPFPYNLLPSQSKGTVRSLKTVLKSGGIKIMSVLNVSDTYNFEKKKYYYFNKAKRIANSI